MSDVKNTELVIKRIGAINRRQLANLKEAVEVTQAAVTNKARAIVPVRTSTLQKSIMPGQVIITPEAVTGEVVATTEYASFVEFGTSRMRPQAYLGPAVMAEASNFARRIKMAVRV